MFRPKPGPSNPGFKCACSGHGGLAQHWLPSVSGRAGASFGLQGHNQGPSRAEQAPFDSFSFSSYHSLVIAQLTAVVSITFNSPARKKTLLITHLSIFCSLMWSSFLCPWGSLSLPPATHFPEGTAALSFSSRAWSATRPTWAELLKANDQTLSGPDSDPKSLPRIPL